MSSQVAVNTPTQVVAVLRCDVDEQSMPVGVHIVSLAAQLQFLSLLFVSSFFFNFIIIIFFRQGFSV